MANNGFDTFDHETSILTQTDSQTETHKICEIFTQKTLAKVGGKGGVCTYNHIIPSLVFTSPSKIQLKFFFVFLQVQMVIEFDQVEFIIVGLSNPLMTYPTFTPVFGSQFRFLSRSDLTVRKLLVLTQFLFQLIIIM